MQSIKIKKRYYDYISREHPIFYIETDFNVASESNDYKYPYGSKNDNTKNKDFNNTFYKVARILGFEKPYMILDLGCAGGGMVLTFIHDKHYALGLEGSDYCEKNRKFEWGIIPNNLFTCDITKPFSITQLSCHTDYDVKFDMITAWEVLEHIKENDLPQLFKNIYNNLKETGFFICTVTHSLDEHNGIVYHQTIKPMNWWVDKFEKHGFNRKPAIERIFNGHWFRKEADSSLGVFVRK